MKLRRLSVLLLCSLVFINVHAAENQTLPVVDKPFTAPNFTTTNESGDPYTLSDFRGKLVILNFWASWCPPCRKEMPSMERLREKLKGKPIKLLAVNVGEDADTVFEFTGHYPVSFPLLLDRDGAIIQSYPVMGLPTTFIISPKGVVTHRIIGSREWDAPKIMQQLLAMSKS